MKLLYNNKEIPVTNTTNETIMKYKYQKLYYAIIIDECNSYSSIQNKQRIDVVMIDNNYKILKIKKDMHENTIFECPNATKVVLLPLNTFIDLKINTHFTIKE